MNTTVDQAQAILALLSGSHGESPDESSAALALSLGSELIALGEYRLVLDICAVVDTRKLTSVERAESVLLRAEACISLGQFATALGLIEPVVAMASEASVEIPKPMIHRAAVLRGRALWRSMRFEEAKATLLEQRTQLLAAPDSPLLGWCTFHLGSTSWSLGDMDWARRYFTEATASAYRTNDLRLEAMATQSLGLMKRSMGHWNEAVECLTRSRELWAGLGNSAYVAHCLRSLAIVDLKRGRLRLAESRSHEAVRLAASIGSEESRCFALEVAALCRLHEGDLAGATDLVNQVQQSPQGGESARAFLLVEELLGDIGLDRGEIGSALNKYEGALTRATAVAPRGDIVAELRRRRGECFYLLGRHDEAYAEAKLGLEHTRELGDRYEEAATYRVAALAAAALGRPEEAKQLFEQGFALFEDIETPYEWGKLWMAFGDWLASEKSGAYHDPRLALEAYHAAHYRFDTMGAKGKLTEVNARIARSTTAKADSIPALDPPGAVTRTPPRTRPSRSRDIDRKTEWARERFGVITANPAVFEILEDVEKLARSRSAVLVLGESGTGKELIAHALHRLSDRKGEFMAINCATLPRDVVESELFGHVAGAFTGASREKVGLLEVCEGGTVFLDEISEMSLELQSRLLRFLESGEIRRVGATRVTKLSTRIVAASNREEIDLRSGQRFRPDLYYRLAHTVVKLPPLRLRGARDIELLAEHFLAVSCAEERRTLVLTEGALQKLAAYTWPGNIRELRSTMSQRAVLTPEGGAVRAEDLRLDSGATSAPATLEEELAQTERRRIEEALRMSRNSKADAARLLGIPRTTLINRMQRLGIVTE